MKARPSRAPAAAPTAISTNGIRQPMANIASRRAARPPVHTAQQGIPYERDGFQAPGAWRSPEAAPLVGARDETPPHPGCHQPAAACQVHHVTHKAHGGPTSLKDCVLLCSFHHQVVIHRWGWTLVLNPDGTTTAWNPDRTKVLHSHGPPPAAAA